ncbi:hypothetical protein M0R45_037226 [Rubus argutus]|uniref:Uncharacterized protein n=1 Tax=Rubus argutus TaxID=59490 RepID=A0AAW1VYK4_RUBAR
MTDTRNLLPKYQILHVSSRVGNLTISPYVADIPDVLCPSCGDLMTYPLYFFSYTSGVGYNREDVIFMIMDNLEVKPMLTISNIIAELNQLNGGVEEKTVHLGTS